VKLVVQAPPGAFRRQRLLLGLLAAAHVLLTGAGACSDSATYCEFANLASGLAYWEYGRADLYPVNPPLAKAVAALPVLACLDLDTDALSFPTAPGERLEFVVGDALLRANAHLYWRVLILGRLPGLGWSLLGGWLVYRWACRLFGPRAGLVGFAVWCLEPNVSAHAHLVTPDVPCAVLTLAAAYSFWSYLRRPGWGRAAAAGALLGLALLAKFTAGLLVPLFLAAWAAALWRPGPPSRRERAGQYLALNGLALLVLNGGYLFAGTGEPLGSGRYVSRLLGGGQAGLSPPSPGNRFAGTPLGRVPSPLPAAFWEGVDVQRRELERYAHGRPCYLRGEWKVGGWYYYYLYAVLVKVPLGALAVFAAGLLWWAAAWRRYRAADYACALLVPAALFGIASSQKALNRHLRYVLPAFPGFAVTAAAAGGWAGGRPRRWALLAGLLGLQAASVAAQAPHTLGYFNELAGGPRNGWRHLSGSNVDWGQDLWWLKRWVDRHPAPGPLYLEYYGYGRDPAVIGLAGAPPPPGPGEGPLPADPAGQKAMAPRPGRFAVTVLEFQKAGPLGQRYLLQLEPAAVAGTSLWVYDVSLEEANRLRRKYGLAPLTPADLP
jgi:hypothetical protein